jgi:hypothetical protein
MEEVTISLTLTKSEWEELPNALISKAQHLEAGEYGGFEAEDEAEDNEWAKELRGIYDKIAKVLDEAGITY